MAALTALSLFAAACGGGGGGQQGQGNEAAGGGTKGKIVLGAVLPLTGPNATIGEDQRRGAELAVEQINKNGGVLGKDVEVVVEDSEGRPEGAIDAARKLVEVNGAPVVIGEYSSGNTLPMGQFLQREGVVHINPGSSSPDLRTIGDFSFGVIGLDDVAGRFLASKVYDRGYRKASLLAPNNPYGQGVLKYTKAAFQDMGGSVVEAILYTEGKTDYRNELDRLSAPNPDVLIYTAYGTEAATINRQAFELGISDKIPFFCLYLTLCAADSDPQTVEGQQGTEVNYIGPNGDWYRRLYEKKYGEDFVSTFNGYVYDAVQLAARAIKASGSTKPDAIRKALYKVDNGYNAATGPIIFDKDGQRSQQPYIFVEVRNGKVVQAGG